MYGHMHCMGSEQEEEWRYQAYLIGQLSAMKSCTRSSPFFCTRKQQKSGYDSWNEANGHVSIFHVTYWVWRVTVMCQLSEQVPEVVWTVHVTVVLKCRVRKVTKISEVLECCYAGSILGGTQLSYVTCTARALTSWCLWEGKERGSRYKAYGW